MSRKAEKSLAFFLAAIMCISMLTLSAFAAVEKTNSSEENAQNNSSLEPQTDTQTTDTQTTPSPNTEKVGHDDSAKGEVLVTINLDGGTGLKKSAYVTKGTRMSEFITPVRSGYEFVGWKVNGTAVSGSYTLTSNANMTAMWRKKTEVSSLAEEPSSSELLSSQDQNALSFSSSSQESGASVSSAPAPTEPISRFSPLFYIGIVLVALGITGIGIFIHVRHSGKGPKGRGGSGYSGGSKEFTDISSYSDGKRHNDASAVLRDARREAKSTARVPKRRSPVPRV